ncbi:MAG TPA: SPOR domain-containing protein [Dongiaceae bacterium]|jgi:cell division septation protein DedD
MPEIIYRQDRVLNAAARAAAPIDQKEPQLFPDLANDDGAGGPEIPPSPYQAAPVAPARDVPVDGGAKGRRYLWIGVGSVSAATILLPLVMWMNHDGQTVVADSDLPVVAAESGPEKVRPVDEGGLKPNNQDVTVYNTINGATQEQSSEGEVLMQGPETPMKLPDIATEPAPPAAAGGADAAGVPAVPAPAFDVPANGADTAPEATAAAKVEPSAGGSAAEQPAAPANQAQPDFESVVEQTASLGKAYRVQLAAVKSRDGAEATWTKLQKKHAQLLSDLQLTIVEFTKDGNKFFRVQAGPFAERSKAVDTCMALKRLEQGCLVVNP